MVIQAFIKPLLRSALAGFILFPSILTAGTPTDGLVAYYPFTNGSLKNEASLEGSISKEVQDSAAQISPGAAPNAENKGATFGPDRFGNENSAAVFSGNNSYIEIPDHDAFSIKTTGTLTISVWVCPKVLTFNNAETGGYVHWMGKGMPQQHEWVFRMYNKELESSQENRPNRMSAYAFNLQGGLGSGSYVQEELTADEWMHIAARYDIQSNTITLFKNGIQKDQDPLYDETYGVQVQNGTAPVRLGTRSLWSFFEGSIDDLRFYNRALTAEEIIALYKEADPNSISTSDSSTVADSTGNENPEKIFARHNSTEYQNGTVKTTAHRGFANPYQIEFTVGNKNVDAIGRNLKSR